MSKEIGNLQKILENLDAIKMRIYEIELFLNGPISDSKLYKKVEELELSIRSKNVLKNDNIVYIGDLVQKTEAEMLRAPNFGRKSLREIVEVLDLYGFQLGMKEFSFLSIQAFNLWKKSQEMIEMTK